MQVDINKLGSAMGSVLQAASSVVSCTVSGGTIICKYIPRRESWYIALTMGNVFLYGLRNRSVPNDFRRNDWTRSSADDFNWWSVASADGWRQFCPEEYRRRQDSASWGFNPLRSDATDEAKENDDAGDT
jgi:hypothetical protein